MIRMKKELLVVIIAILILTEPGFGLMDPSAVYCEKLGYEWMIEETPDGEFGICKLPDGSTCDSWDFLEGKCGEEYSYCKKKGYELKTISDPEKCSSIFSEECAVCVLENGEEIEVTKLMELEFRAGRCGDGVCAALEENYENCPKDCPSGSFDMYCDKVKDGICDPDCVEQEMPEEDPDCVVVTTTITEITTTIKITTTTETPIKRCGDHICEPKRGENYFTCPEDCPSGGEDNYCDALEDGKCDPDCKSGEDPDCGFGYLPGYWPYIIVLFVIIIVIIIYKKMREE